MEQLFGELARMRYIAPAPAIDELDIAALCPTQGLQSLPENRHPCLSFKIVGDSHQYANSPHSIRLLRTCSPRPGRRGAQKDHELTPSDVGHGLSRPGVTTSSRHTQAVSLPHAQCHAEWSAGPWVRSELFWNRGDSF